MVRGVIVDIKSPNIMGAWTLGHDAILGRMLKENRMSPQSCLTSLLYLVSYPMNGRLPECVQFQSLHGHGIPTTIVHFSALNASF